jgi:hypothetical protein
MRGATPCAKEEESSKKRGHRRYSIHLPVVFTWSAGSGAMRQGRGRSRDISELGAFVFARNLPVVGASICLSIPFQSPGGRTMQMEMTGEVVRVELPLRRKFHWGFAVAGRTGALNLSPDQRKSSLVIQ